MSDRSILIEQILNEEAVVIRNFFTHVFPALDETARTQYLKKKYPHHLNHLDSEKSTALYEAIGFSDELGFQYINTYLARTERDQWDSYPYLSEAIEALDVSVDKALYQACFALDGHLASQIFDRKGKVDIWVARFPDDEARHLINGKETFFYPRIYNHSGENIRQCIDVAIECGFQSIYGLDGRQENSVFNYARAIVKNSDEGPNTDESFNLPVFSKGVITNPELMLAMHNAAHPAYPKIHSRVPCWIPDNDLDLFRTATAYEAERTIIYSSNDRPSGWADIDLSSIKPDLIDTLGDVTDIEIEFGLKPRKDISICDVDDAARLRVWTPKEIQLGFAHLKNHVLCLVDIAELRQHEVGAVDEGKLECCVRLANNGPDYQMFHEMYHRYGENVYKSAPEREEISGFKYVAYDGTFWTFLGEANSKNMHIVQGIKKHLGDDAFRRLVGVPSTTVAVNLYNLCSINNAQILPPVLSASAVVELNELGYLFKQGTTLADVEIEGDDREYFIEHEHFAAALMELGVWPDVKPEPKTIEACLDRLLRAPMVSACKIRLHNEGIEKTALACRNKRDWGVVFDTFAKEELAKVVHLMPSSFRVRQLEDDFSL